MPRKIRWSGCLGQGRLNCSQSPDSEHHNSCSPRYCPGLAQSPAPSAFFARISAVCCPPPSGAHSTVRRNNMKALHSLNYPPRPRDLSRRARDKSSCPHPPTSHQVPGCRFSCKASGYFASRGRPGPASSVQDPVMDAKAQQMQPEVKLPALRHSRATNFSGFDFCFEKLCLCHSMWMAHKEAVTSSSALFCDLKDQHFRATEPIGFLLFVQETNVQSIQEPLALWTQKKLQAGSLNALSQNRKHSPHRNLFLN